MDLQKVKIELKEIDKILHRIAALSEGQLYKKKSKASVLLEGLSIIEHCVNGALMLIDIPEEFHDLIYDKAAAKLKEKSVSSLVTEEKSESVVSDFLKQNGFKVKT